MQACNEIFLRGGEESPMAIYYLSNSLKHVRERLQSREALSDSTIGLVMSFITQEEVRGQHKAARIHMNGLAKMVEVRGGLTSLEGCLPVLLKACKYVHLAEISRMLSTDCMQRTDIMFALQHETEPSFRRDEMPNIIHTLAALDVPFDLEASQNLGRRSKLSPALLKVFLDVQSASRLFNNKQFTRKIDLFLYQDMIVSVFYRLLAISFHQDDSLPPTIDDAYHVGLSLFMMSLFLQHGRNRILQFHNITTRLRTVLNSHILEQEPQLEFWLLMMDGVWVGDDEGTDWLPPMVKDQARKLGLRTWTAVRKAVAEYPWIGELHDSPGKITWEKANKL